MKSLSELPGLFLKKYKESAKINIAYPSRMACLFNMH